MMPETMRIAVLSVHSCPVGALGARDTGGMSVYIRELAREMGRMGHRLDIYTRTHDPADPPVMELGDNVRLVHLPAGDEDSRSKLDVYPHLPRFTASLEDFRWRGGLDYDLVFSHYWLSGLVGNCLREWWHVPHITMFHTLGVVKNAIGIGEGEPELRLEMEREIVRKCQRIIAPTQREKDNLVTGYGAPPSRVGVVPCGVNLEQFRPVAKACAREKLGLEGGKVILYVGRIEPLKGIDRLIRAFASLPRREEMRLVIIGGDESSQREIAGLKALAGELGIGGLVVFAGLVRHEGLPSYYSAADVCVVPSFYESFGLVMVEALACGTPVVASDVGDARNIIVPGRTGYVTGSNEPRRLAEKMRLVLSGADILPAPRVRASVLHLGWERIARSVVAECRRVLRENLAAVG